MAYKVSKHLQNKEKDKWSVTIVPKQFGFILSGNSVVDFNYQGGSLSISRYAQEETRLSVNSYIVSSRIETTASNYHLWNNLELSHFQVQS